MRCFLAGVWQGATKEHSHRRSVTEEQRRQTPARKQPGGLPIFAAAAALLVSRRSIRIFSFLAPRSSAKSPATRPFPIYERGSKTNTSCQLALPTHGFTVVLSVFGGTPLIKPLNCKIRFFVRAAIRPSRAHHTGDQPMLVFAKFSLSP